MSKLHLIWMAAALAALLNGCDRPPPANPAPNEPREQPAPVADNGDADEVIEESTDVPQAPSAPAAATVMSDAQKASIEPLPGDGDGADPVVPADAPPPRTLSADNIPLDSLIIDPVAPATPEDQGQVVSTSAKTTIRPTQPQNPVSAPRPQAVDSNTIEDIPTN